MNDREEPLLEAILAAPDDDAPRLVYADWLLLQGDPRGELIQLQCRRESENLPNAARRKMRIAENKLIAEYEAKAAGDISELLGFLRDARLVRPELRRGFIYKVKAPATILRRLDDVLAIAPLVEELELQFTLPYTDEPPQLTPEDFAAAGLARIRGLRFALPHLDVSSLQAIANAPNLRNVRDLAISNTRWFPRSIEQVRAVANDGARVLIESPHLKLRSLAVDEGCFGNDGVDTLLGNKWALESLNLANSGCDGRICEALANTASFSALRRLNLREVFGMLPQHAARLASAPNLKQLSALDLEKCDLHAEGIKAFLDAFALPALEELVIASNTLADAGGLAVAQSTKLSGLRFLDITKNRLGKKAMVALAGSEQFRNLRKILIHDRDTPDTREALAKSKILANTQVYFRGHIVPKKT